MKNRSKFCAAAAFAAVLCVASLGRAQDDTMVDPTQAEPMQEETSHLDDYGDSGKGCCEVCCDQSTWFFGAEATFFKFHEAKGVNDGAFEDAEFDNEISPRLTAGYVGCDGLGVRLRYWDFDESVESDDDQTIAVDTYTLDLEVFQVVELGSCTCVEFIGGVRYNEFDFFRESGVGPDDETSFDGFGGIVGIALHRDLCGGLGMYAGLREIIMADDADFSSVGSENDTIRPVTEIALGVDYTSCNWSVHAGYEWQVWNNYVESAGFTNIDFETSDIGFVGFVIGAEYAY